MSDQHSPQEREIATFEVTVCIKHPHVKVFTTKEGPYCRECDLHAPHISTKRIELVPAAALQGREAEAERLKEKLDEGEALLGEYGTGGSAAGLVPAIHNLASRAEKAGDRANRAEAALREAGPKIRAVLSTESNYEAGWCEETTAKIMAALDTSIGDREPEKCERCGGRGKEPAGPFDKHRRFLDHTCGDCGGTGTKPPAPCSDRASTRGGSDDGPLESRGEPEPDGGLAPETSVYEPLRHQFRRYVPAESGGAE